MYLTSQTHQCFDVLKSTKKNKQSDKAEMESSAQMFLPSLLHPVIERAMQWPQPLQFTARLFNITFHNISENV